MKKIISLLLVLCVAASLAACSRESTKEDNSAHSKNIRTENSESAGGESTDMPKYDAELLEALENAVYTTQPGTAGSSFKAVYAVHDLLSRLKENKPDKRTIAATVKYMFENSEYADDAVEAFLAIKDAYTVITESEAARQLLESVQLAPEDFEVPREVSRLFEAIMAEIEKY